MSFAWEDFPILFPDSEVRIFRFYPKAQFEPQIFRKYTEESQAPCKYRRKHKLPCGICAFFYPPGMPWARTPIKQRKVNK